MNRVSHPARSKVAPSWDLTPAQLGIYYHCVTSEYGGDYVEQPNWFIDGDLNLEMFKKSWETVMCARDNLRLYFTIDPTTEQLTQQIEAQPRVDFRFFDWQESSTTPASTRDRLDALLQSDRTEPFDLESAPLWRIYVVRLAKNRYWFCWTIHHLISDGWSATLVLADVFRTYGALASGRRAPSIQVGTFTSYLDSLGGANFQESEKYWIQRFADYEFQLSGSNEVTTDAEPGRADRTLSEDDFKRLCAFARKHRLTLATVTGCAWAAVLANRTGKTDVIYGSVSAGRPPNLNGVEQVSGPFMAVLPTRTKLIMEQPIVDWLSNQQVQQAADRDNAQAAHKSSVEMAQPIRPESLFAFQNYPDAAGFAPLMEAASHEGLKIRDGIFYYSFTHYPIDVTVLPNHRSLQLSVHANLQHLSELEIEEIADDYVLSLNEISNSTTVDDLLQRISSTNAELAHAELPFQGTDILSCFLDQVNQRPDSQALRDAKGAMTFRDVERASRDYAAILKRNGVGPESVVGLDLPRGSKLVVFMLAVWRSGGAFFVHNRQNPPERIRRQLAQAEVKLVVAEDGALWAHMGLPVVNVSGSIPTATEFTDPELKPRQLAYVTATSGTTGEPRIVQNEHGGLADHVGGQLKQIYPDASSERIVVVGSAPPTFDAFLDNILPSLALGHLAVLNEEENRWDPTRARELVAAGENYVVDCTPSQLVALLAVDPGILSDSDLRGVVFGGEKPPAELWSLLRESSISNTSFSVYGATESSIGSALCVPGVSSSITIGDSSRGTRIMLLNDGLQPTANGQVGQIFIAGTGVGRGYAGAAVSTASAFLPDPWATMPGSRMYATGDLGRRTSAGIEFCGRSDSQVKMRGIRVDLAEIEQAFEREPGVQRAFALLTGAGQQSLGCLLQMESPQEIERVLLSVRGELPENLVPTQLATCTSLPLTAIGKVDAQAARSLFEEESNTGVSELELFASLQISDAERRMCSIWAEVLEVNRVRPDDDFFRLGGHSLAAIALSARISGSLKRSQEIVRLLLQCRTPRNLCKQLGAEWTTPAEREPLRSVDRSIEVDMPAAQRRLWLLDMSLAESDRPIYHTSFRLHFEGTVDRGALREAVFRVLNAHETFRLRYGLDGTRPVVRVMDIDPEIFHKVIHDGESLDWPVFDLSQPPCVRVNLSESSDGGQDLTFIVHHISIDGASLPVMHEELKEAYADVLAGRVSKPTSAIDLLDYSEWQRLQGPNNDVNHALRYWASELFGAEPTVFPKDRSASVLGSSHSGTSFRTLDNTVQSALCHASSDLGGTHFELSTAVLVSLLAAHTGQEDVLIGVPVSGRWHPQSDNLLGFLSNTLALRMDTSGDPCLADLVPHVADRMRDALGNQSVAFDDVLSSLPIRHPLRRNGLGVLMQFSHQVGGLTHTWGDSLTATVQQIADPMSRFPLSLNLTDLGNSIHLECNYDPNSYSESTIEKFIDRFVWLLEAGSAEPTVSLRRLLRSFPEGIS